MIKRVIFVSVMAVACYLGATANLGERTLYGHLQNIWDSEEMIEMRDDLAKLGPASLAVQRPGVSATQQSK